jgi:hypothetical protein
MRAGLTSAPRAGMAELHQQGYRGEFHIDGDGALCCPICGTCQPAARAILDRVQPAGATVVLAIRCPACGERGTAVVAVGPGAPRGDVALRGALAALSAIAAHP